MKINKTTVLGIIIGLLTVSNLYLTVRGQAPATATTVAGQIVTQPVTTGHTAAYSRDQLKEMVTGKTPDQIIAIIGKPIRTKDDMWIYNKITYDTITDKDDDDIYIWVHDGVCTHISN